MSSRFILPLADVGSGIKPSDGAKLFFSENGLPFSTNPKDTFTDNTDATPNANPVIADSKGVFPDIYIVGSNRAVLKDKNDVQIWQEDDIDELTTVGSAKFPKNFATLEGGSPSTSAVENTTNVVGDAINAAARTSGNNGGAMWDVVLTTDVTPNTFNIVIGIGNPLLSFVLRNPTMRNVEEWGAVLDGATDVIPAMQNYADFAKLKDMTLRFPDGDYLFNSPLDLSAAGGGDEGHRNLEVICGNEAKFSAANNTINIFDISGQKRFYWTGGWFRKANICFDASGGVGPAYAFFSLVVFDGDGASSIKRCYKADTSIGVFWTYCQFGTDNVTDQIELAIELTGIDSDQTNINKFIDCVFINLINGVDMPDSSFPRLQISFVDCWFELINGFAINAGTNTKALGLIRTYFEAVGSVTETPIILKNSTMDIEGCQIVGLQNNDDHFITANTGASINCYGTTEFGSSNGRKFVNYATINSYQNLNGIRIIDLSTPGTLSYEDLLFDTVAQSDEKFIDWSMPALSSSLTDSEPKVVSRKNQQYFGFISKVTDVVQLTAVSTLVDVATINIPNAGNGIRFSVEVYETIQGVGHGGRFEETLAHFAATWQFTSITGINTVAGFTFNYVSVDTNNFKIQVQRTVGGATNTPVRVKIMIHQAADNMFGNEIKII